MWASKLPQSPVEEMGMEVKTSTGDQMKRRCQVNLKASLPAQVGGVGGSSQVRTKPT